MIKPSLVCFCYCPEAAYSNSALPWFILCEVQESGNIAITICQPLCLGDQWLKEDQAKLFHTAIKSTAAFWLQNVREKVKKPLTVEIAKNIRGGMLAMSSALGSEEKNRTRLVLTLKLTFFYFFLQPEEDLQAKMSPLIFNLYFKHIFWPHFYGLVFGVIQYKVAVVLISLFYWD